MFKKFFKTVLKIIKWTTYLWIVTLYKLVFKKKDQEVVITDMAINNKKEINNNITVDTNTNGILIAILHELKDINKTLTKHDVVLNNHEVRIQKLEK